MSQQHAMLAINAQFEKFVHDNTTLPFAKRAPMLARIINHSGADLVALSEAGSAQAATIAAKAGPLWRYQRAQGPDGRGLNSVMWRTDRWDWIEKRSHDWNLGSFGQWPRTFLLLRLEEKGTGAWLSAGATHLAAVGAPLDRAGANRAKLAQTRQVVDLIGERRTLVGLDLPRTDATDDEAYLRAHNVTLHGRTGSTPLVTMSTGAVRVSESVTVKTGDAADHDAVLTTFTLPAPVDPA